MNSEKNIFIAFILNLSFSVFELFGGIITGSASIISDSIHDMGDALSIGTAFLLEKKSNKQPDNEYTYGYTRYSVIGSLLTTVILLIGSTTAIINSVEKIFNPSDVNHNGMIIFALFGVCVNFAAAYFTREKGSLNHKAVNLHMLEDVLGWAVVLVGAIIIKFTGFVLIDPIMSIGIAVFILTHALKNLKEITDIFLEKAPDGITPDKIKEHLFSINEIVDVHHIHIWSMDGTTAYATMHIVADSHGVDIKEKIRNILSEHNIHHSTLEFESEDECCKSPICSTHFHHSHPHRH